MFRLLCNFLNLFSGSSSLWRRWANHVRIVIRSMVISLHFPRFCILLNFVSATRSYFCTHRWLCLPLPVQRWLLSPQHISGYILQISAQLEHHSYPESAPFWGVLFLLVYSSTGLPIFFCDTLCVSMFKLRSGCTNASIKTSARLLLYPYKCVRFQTIRLMMNGMLPHSCVHDNQRAQ